MTDRQLVRAALTITLLIIMTGRVITRVFVLNFSTAGPNATAVLALTLVTGGTVTVGLQSHSQRRDLAFAGAAAVGVAVSLVSTPLVSLGGAALALWTLTPLAAGDAGRLDDQLGVAAGLGILLIVLIRAATGTTAPHATTLGRISVVVLAVALVAVSLQAHDNSVVRPERGVRYVAPLAAVVLCVAAWFGAPVASARWAGLSYQLTLAVSAAGLVTGMWVVTRGASRVSVQVGIAAGALLVGMGSVLAGGPLAVGGVGLTAAALPVLSGTGGLGRVTPLRAGLVTACAQTGCLLTMFGFVFAINATFVPGGAVLRGTAPAFVLGLAVVVGLTAVVVAVLSQHATTDPPADDDTAPVAVDSGRRATLAGLVAGSISLPAARARTPRAGADTPEDLRVATYNVHRYVDTAGVYNLESVATLFEAHRLGVIGVQETTGTRLTTGHTHGVRWLADRLGYHYAMAPATSADGYGVALLSAWPISDTQTVSLPRGDGASRVALRASVEHPDGTLPVVVTHLATSGPVRSRQATQVRRLVADANDAVVLGDFNATPGERPIAVMTEAFTDAWTVAGTGVGKTFDATTPSRRIDYVFTRGVRVQAAAVFGTDSESDHRGVYATIERDRG